MQHNHKVFAAITFCLPQSKKFKLLFTSDLEFFVKNSDVLKMLLMMESPNIRTKSV